MGLQTHCLACVLRGPRNAWSVRPLRNCRLLSFSPRVGHVPAATAAASCPSRSRSAARAACSGSLAMMHQANASRLQLRAKRCNLNIPFRTYGLRTHDFSTYESYVRTSVPFCKFLTLVRLLFTVGMVASYCPYCYYHCHCI